MLEFLTELAQEVATNTELQPILDWIVKKTTTMLSADEGSIKLLESEAAKDLGVTSFRTDKGHWPSAVSSSLVSVLLEHGQPLTISDLLNDSRFPGFRGGAYRLRSILAVPLKVENRVTGMLGVAAHQPGRAWTREEERLLTVVASHSAGVLERARHRAESQARDKREAQNRAELAVAHRIQLGLVPAGALRVGPWEMFGRVLPAGQIGGDYFDYFPLGAERFGIAIADVEGKGVPAALMVSSVRALLRAYCDGRRPVSEAFREMNRNLATGASTSRFVTMFYGEADCRRGLMRFTNAGHPYPLLRREAGRLEKLAAGGYPLGMFEDAVYEEGEAVFVPGEALLLYSDGVPDTENPSAADFGGERLDSLWQSCCTLGADEIIKCVFSQLEAFRGGAPQTDDITVIAVTGQPRT